MLACTPYTAMSLHMMEAATLYKHMQQPHRRDCFPQIDCMHVSQPSCMASNLPAPTASLCLPATLLPDLLSTAGAATQPQAPVLCLMFVYVCVSYKATVGKQCGVEPAAVHSSSLRCGTPKLSVLAHPGAALSPALILSTHALPAEHSHSQCNPLSAVTLCVLPCWHSSSSVHWPCC